MYVEYGAMVLFNPSPWYEKKHDIWWIGSLLERNIVLLGGDYTFHP